MKRHVLLPRSIDETIFKLTDLKQESAGVLIYTRNQHTCHIDHLYMTSLGDEGQAQSQPERTEILNHLFSEVPFGYIDVHTHSKGTIQKYGQYYARHFSDQDMGNIVERVEDDREYMSMLVTPEIKLLWGIDNPILSVVDDTEESRTTSRLIKETLDKIAGEIDYHIEGFVGTKA